MVIGTIAGIVAPPLINWGMNKLFGGGGSSGGGGGGGVNMNNILPETLPFVEKYLEDQFGLGSTASNPFADYFETNRVKKTEGRELAEVIGQSMFRGATPTRKQVKDAYSFAKLTGNTDSSNQAQQAISSYFSQTPEGMKYRLPSSQELLAGMKYGPLIGTESGVKLFAGTDRTRDMFGRLDQGRNFRRKNYQNIFNS